MPDSYSCSACRCRIEVGGFHDVDDHWRTLLHCRHCFARYHLTDITEAAVAGTRLPPGTRVYRLSYGRWSQDLLSGEALTPPSIPHVTCIRCEASGPLGPNGPLSDRAPEKVIGVPEVAAGERKWRCPACRQESMQLEASWVS